MLLEREATATSAVLLSPWLERQGWPHVICRAARPALDKGDLVVIVRYLTRELRQTLEQAHSDLSGVVYFMDDDLWDPATWRGLPWRYRLRLYREALQHLPWIRRFGTELWVSTSALAAKYAAWSPRTVPLVTNQRPLDTPEPVWVAYHGTASHSAEIAWLQPVLAQALARCPALHLEIFGDRRVAALYRSLPRVAVLHPMPWPAYRAYTAATRRDIGLAPLRPSAFNAARGAVKFMDYARMGAVGLYSAVPPYDGFVRDNIDGLLLPDEPEAWVEALVALASDTPRRVALQQAACQRAFGPAP